jgi:alkylation response protein AidB-like acyl-CoA dehydrogenase
MNLRLTEEEHLIKNTVREFAERQLAPKASYWDEMEEFPWENIAGLSDLGLMGLTIGDECDGSGGTYRQLAIVVEELARCCAATSLIYLAHLSLGTSTLYRFGNSEQRQRLVPHLASGKKIAAWALTEPEAGSDATNLLTSANKGNGGYKINGTKVFVTNGDVADTLVIFATQEHTTRSKGILSLVVEKGTPGMDIVKQKGKMGMRGSSTAEIVFQDCHVPETNLIGEEGNGFKIAMQILDTSRISIAAQSVGMAQAALESALRYSRERHAFGRPIADLAAIQGSIADMATKIEAARLLTTQAATLVDMGLKHGQESSMAKLFSSEIAMECANRALQIHGGYGYFKPNSVERLFRDARVAQIYEGTSEIQRLVIARHILATM